MKRFLMLPIVIVAAAVSWSAERVPEGSDVVIDQFNPCNPRIQKCT